VMIAGSEDWQALNVEIDHVSYKCRVIVVSLEKNI
jgi:hypothetical protein